MADDPQFTPALPAPENDAPDPVAAPAPEHAPDIDPTAEGLVENAHDALDPHEAARQMEALTSVVLDSAEVSTRSAAIAADISGVMRDVVVKIQDSNRRNVLHSRVMVGAFMVCLVMAMGVFFGVTLKMTGSIKALDTVVYAMTKRVVEVDASMIAISKTHADFSELTQQQADLATSQGRLASRLEELGRTVSGLPMAMAEQSNKLSEPRFSAMQRDLQGMAGKVQGLEARLQEINVGFQALDGKLQSVAQTLAKQQAMAQDLQKLRQDLEASSLKTQHLAERVLAKSEAQMASGSKAASPASPLPKTPPQKPAASKAGSDKSAPDKATVEKTTMEHASPDKAASDKAASDKAEDDRSAVERARAQQPAPAMPPPAVTQLQYPRYPRVPDAASHP